MTSDTTLLEDVDNDRSAQFDTALYYIMLFFAPIAIGVGVVGNVASLAVIIGSPTLRRMASNVYLVALAVCDLAFLSTLIFTWLDFVVDVAVHRSTVVGCKLLTYIAQASDMASVWLIVAVSSDRFMVLFAPMLRRRLTQKHFQLWLMLAIVGGTALISTWSAIGAAPIPFSINDQNATVDYNCDTTFGPTLFNVFNTFDTVASCFLPTLLILSLNVAVARRWRRSTCCSSFLGRYDKSELLRKKSREWYVLRLLKAASMGPGTQETKLTIAKAKDLSQPLRSSDVLVSVENGERPEFVVALATSPEFGPNLLRLTAKTDRHITRALLVVTTSYVLMTTPSYVVRMVAAFHVFRLPEADTAFFVMKCFELAAYSLYYAHHSLNFYLYTFFSPQMRRCFVAFYRRCFCGWNWRFKDVTTTGS